MICPLFKSRIAPRGRNVRDAGRVGPFRAEISGLSFGVVVALCHLPGSRDGDRRSELAQSAPVVGEVKRVA